MYQCYSSELVDTVVQNFRFKITKSTMEDVEGKSSPCLIQM